MKYFISLIAITLCLSVGWAKEEVKGAPEGKGKPEKVAPKGKAHGLDKEFENNMPEEVKAKVEALKAIAAQKREAYKALKGLEPEAAKAKKEEIQATVKAQRDALLEKMSKEEKEKVEKILEDVDKENKGKGEQRRNRQQAISVLKEKLAANPDAKGTQNALDHVQNKKGKPDKQ